MKTLFSLPLVGLLIAGSVVAQEPKTEVKAENPASILRDLKSKVAYSIGLNMGQSLKRQSIMLDPAVIAKGIADGLSQAKPALTPEQITECMKEFEKELASKAKVTDDKNVKEGEKFLAANKVKEGVKTLKSGLQYRVLKEGKGATPKSSDSVIAHYKGTLIDGTKFDSSYDRGEPSTFPVTGVIAGWTEALQLMKVGSKWELVIPAELAYGSANRDPIPPNSVLVFEVELVGIE